MIVWCVFGLAAGFGCLHALLPQDGSMDVVKDVIGGTAFVVAVVVGGLMALAFSPLALPFRKLPKGKPRRGILNERYAKSKVTSQDFDVVVIGSGMGGLCCAASLSRFGKKVLVLEQHDVAGGGTHTFVVDGKSDYNFDSGLHYTVPQSGELLQLACGTRDKPVEFDKLGESDGCFDKVVLGDLKDDGLRVKHGQAHLSKLREMFPSERDQKDLDEFLRVANMVNDRAPVWMLSKVFPKWARQLWKKLFLGTFTEYSKRTGEEVTNELVSNPKLAALLCGLWMDAGSPPYRASFMMTAALSVGFPKEGGAYPTGGSEKMATCLIQAIEAAGGKVLVRARVDKILVKKKQGGFDAQGVRLVDGTEVTAPIVVSACGYGNTYTKLLPDEAVPNGYVTRDEKTGVRSLPKQIDNSASWVMANIGIKGNPEELGLGCSNAWIQPCHEENGWNIFDGVREYFEKPLDVKTIPMMITFPSIKDRACKDGQKNRITCQLLALSGKGWFDAWECENGDHPKGGEYETLKKKWEDRLVGALLERHPALEGKIDFVDLSTPLSIKYYLNKPGGGAVGLDVTPNRFADETTEDLLDMQTPVDGLWLTGEDSLLCGQPLAQLSGILTAWRISGLGGSLKFLLGIFRLAFSDALGL
uniref:Amine oxidase domain-containing protein n=1 Tax=Mucochytrium quahogii TaxID=96639 RepID=A0A7S2S4B8_9STRA|mmetsp:Transcript_18178/g.29523  ORF Transcript_18178/g.29523 Transcript_18178/m.29523 type:complete len:643 (+) Transcript_18178:123-2051(+)